VLGTFGQVHLPEGHADCAGGDEDDAVTILDQLYGCLDYNAEDGKEWFMRGFGDDGACSCIAVALVYHAT
jgi:hypothetical protein